MKKTLLTIPAFLLGLFLLSAQEIQLDTESIDYQTVAYGSNGERTFNVSNSGDKPLIITNVQTSCGCTVAEYPKKAILPGDTVPITVAYDTKREGVFRKSIQIFSNSLERGRVVVSIKGEVKK